MSSSVTALVPAYQAADFIQPTLDSLSAQTHTALRVVVSVDASDDDTLAICQRHAQRDPRMRVIQQSNRLGWVGNSNFLLRQAPTDYALFAFHDDILAHNYIEKLAQALDNNTQAVVAYSDVLLTDAKGKQEYWTYDVLEGQTLAVNRAARVMERRGNWWVPNRGVFRMAMARQARGLKTHGAGEFSADWPWLFHLSLLGPFVRVPELLCHKFYKPGSLSRSWAFSPAQNYEAHAACMRELWNSPLGTREKLLLAGPLMQWLTQNVALAIEPGAAA